MATIDNYKIKIQVEGQEQVKNLTQSLDGLQTTLNRTAAAGIAAFTALGVSAVRMADQMVDVADAIGVSAGRIYQLNAALEQAGGQFGNAGGLLRGFSKSLGDVEKGSKETLDALYKLGLSKDQIENLSDDQLFQAVVDGLGKMEAGFERNRLGMILTGKAGDGIDWTKMSEGSKKAIDPALEERLRLAADAMGQIESAFREFQLAALQAITPVLEAINAMNIDADGARKAIQVLGALIAAAFGASTVIGVKKIVDLMKDFGKEVRKAGGFMAFLTGLSGVGLAAIAASTIAATAAYYALGKAMEDAGDAKDKLEGTAPATPGAPATAGGKPARKIGKTPEQEAAEKQLASLQAQTAEMETQNAAAVEYEKIINGTIGLSQELADIKKIDAQLAQDRAKSEANYEKQIAVLRADKSKDNSLAIAELEKQQKLADEQLIAMAGLKKDAVERGYAEKVTTTELQKQLGILQEQSATSISTETARLRAKVISGELTQKEMDDQLALFRLRAQGKSAEEQLEQRIAKEKDTNTKKQLQNDLNALKMKNAREVEDYNATKDFEKNKANSFVAGITEALGKTENMLTPFEKGLKMTESIFQNLENAILNFANTGKLSFKDLALSIVKDLLKIELQAQRNAIFSSLRKAGGNILTTILGSLFKAEGGPVKGNSPYIVGEKGPELFVPKSAGTVIPNNKLSASTEAMGTGRVSAPVTNNYITNNISALDAKSVAQLFAENRKTLLGVTETARREMAYA